MPVPGQLTAQQFTLETSLPVSAGTKAQLDTALQRFARDQVSSVLADPSAEPRQVSVNVDAVPLTATHYWLATVSAAVVGGKIGAMELAGLLASRCADAVPPTVAQPPRSRLSGCGAVLGRTTRPSTSPCWRTPRRRRMKDCSRCVSRSARSSPSGLVSCSARCYRAWCAACCRRRHSPNVWLLTRRRTTRQRACDESHVPMETS
jgi:hypothetical protein